MTAAMRDMDFSGMGKPSMLRFNLHRYGLPRTTRSRCSAPSSASTTSAQPATGRPSSSSDDTPRLTPSGFSTTMSYRAERWRNAIENPGHAGAIQPARGAGVPGPAPTADVRGFGVDVGRDDVRLDGVARDACRRRRATDRIQHDEQLAGLVSVSERGKGHHRPDRRVRVLAAVLAHARRVAFDVA